VRSQGQQLADLLIDGAAKDFIRASLPRPQFVRDLEATGWTMGRIGQRGTYYDMRLSGFYVFSEDPINGYVQLTVTLCGKQPRSNDELISIALHDRALWEEPIGAANLYWSSAKPVLLIWHKTLKFSLPPDDDPAGLPSFSAWKRNWDILRRDLRLRQNEKP